VITPATSIASSQRHGGGTLTSADSSAPAVILPVTAAPGRVMRVPPTDRLATLTSPATRAAPSTSISLLERPSCPPEMRSPATCRIGPASMPSGPTLSSPPMSMPWLPSTPWLEATSPPRPPGAYGAMRESKPSVMRSPPNDRLPQPHTARRNSSSASSPLQVPSTRTGGPVPAQ